MGRLESLEAIMNSVKSTMSMRTEFDFMCYTDGMFCYGYIEGDKYYEMNIIGDNTMMKEMSIRALINVSRLSYVSYSIYTNYEDGVLRQSELVASWSANAETSLN